MYNMYDVSPQAWSGTAIYFHFNNSVSVHMISRKVSWLAEGDIAESAWCSSETKDENTPTVSENLHNQNGTDALRPASTEEPYPRIRRLQLKKLRSLVATFKRI